MSKESTSAMYLTSWCQILCLNRHRTSLVTYLSFVFTFPLFLCLFPHFFHIFQFLYLRFTLSCSLSFSSPFLFLPPFFSPFTFFSQASSCFSSSFSLFLSHFLVTHLFFPIFFSVLLSFLCFFSLFFPSPSYIILDYIYLVLNEMNLSKILLILFWNCFS